MPNPSRRVLGLAIACLGLPWVGAEWLLPSGYDMLSLRLGFAAGVAASPILYFIYRRSLRGSTADAMMGILLSFFWKAFILAGSTTCLWYFFDIDVVLYITPLFFSLFSLGFFAIYLARRSVSNSPKDRPRHDSYA